MIPKKLTIKGLYSYSEEATIDFEQLSQAHIFGIFGNVGSGKSAILEAMMLALYGEVPRLGHGKGDNRNFNMMNLKSNDLCVDFEFEAGGKKYKSIVETKRNSKRFEEVASPRFRRYTWDLENSEWTPTNFNTEEVIGLKLEHFTKTIIVPQNQFQEFLQLKDTERAKMMSDLFNLERFDLSKKAVSLENKNKIKVSEVHIQLEQIGDVSKEQIVDLVTQLNDLELLTNEDTINLKEKIQAETDAQQLKKQFETLTQLKNQLIDFENRTPQYNALEKQLNDYEYCQLHFNHLIEQRELAIKSVNNNAQLLNQKKTEFIDNERFLNETKTLHKSLHPSFDNRHNRLREAEELNHVLTIQKAEKTIDEKTKQVESGMAYANKKRVEIDVLKQERTAIETERSTLKSPNVLELQAVKDWFSKHNGLIKETETLGQQVKKLTESLDTINVNHQFLITNSLPIYGETYPLSITLSETILALKKGIQNRESAKLVSNKKMQRELAVLELENLATTIVEGEPCPLCGSVHHPEVMNATDVHRVVAAIEKGIAELNLTIKHLQNIENQVETLHTTFTKTQNDRKVLLNQITDKRIETEQHAATFIWSNFSKNDEAAVNTAFSTADATVKRIDALNKNVQIKNKKIEEETATLSKYEDKINRLRSDIAVENGQKQTLENQLQTLKLIDFLNVSETTISNKQLAIKEEVKALEKQFAEIEKQVEKRAERDAVLRGGISELERNKTQLDLQLLTVENALNTQLAASNFTDIEAIKSILSVKLNVEFERKRLNNFRTDSNAAQKTHDALNAELNSKQYSLDNHQLLINDIQDLNEKIEFQNRQIGGFKATIADLKTKLNRRNQLETERRALDLRAKNISELKRLFYASGFVSYVSTVFLKNLCETANHRFIRLTNHRLRLEITADNTFLVRDLLNDGQTRHVKTLSGGQTFQAALSLALALADNIQSLTKSPQNFFFLDEGFGSLDKDSLQIVFETLKSLRKENRIVGVISHVEEMQQEIERYVRVVLDEERGSQLSYF
jgi:DNA repair protein SbcC/Rad50